VEITLERGKDDPQRIFESLNSTGLALTQSDLIRNFILMDLEPIHQEEVFDTIWNPIEKNAYNYQSQESVVSDFIRNYLTLKNKKIPKKLGVFEEFKKIALTKSPEQFQSDLIEIKELSISYNKIINPATIQDKEISTQIKYINRLEINDSYPLLIKLFEDLEKNKVSRKDFLRILKLLQSYSWRRFVVGLPTNALNKVFMSLASEIDESDYYNSIAIALLKKSGSGLFPKDEEFRSSIKEKNFYNIRSKNKSYMFEVLENYQNNEYVDTNNSQITIEHIFPQNPDKDWLNEMESNEYIEFQNKYLNTIGNLTLSGNNGALGNKSFKKKLEMNVKGGEQGYKFSRLWLNRDLKTYTSWNREYYSERTNILIERFLKIWSYPDVVLQISEKETEQNIFECDPPTNKNLDYYIFLDEKKLVNSVTQMYIEVLSDLFTLNPKLFIHQDYILVDKDIKKF
ncbi:MAG: DUF262 domain-containing protein, partial [Ignavibacteriae bacterium]|nr:DUF262 domain-containing protein [Ignavibacteriota bacterium]